MKNLLTLGSALFLTVNAFGQSVSVKQDTTVVFDQNPHKVITNGFWDNWFIGAGAGYGIFFGDHDKQMEFKDRLAPNFDVNIGKAFTPSLSVRAGVSSYKVNGLTQNHGDVKPAHSTGERYDKIDWDGYWLEKQEFKFYNIHADVMFNIVNAIGGYKPERFYSVSPYLSLGWAVVNEEPKQKEVTAGIGLYNAFRITKGLDLTLDIRGTMANDRIDGDVGERKQDGNLSALLGLTFKLPRQTWDRPSTTTITSKYDDTELNALRDRINQLANDNDALRNQLANAKTQTITNVEIKKQMLAAPILVTFPINKSTVSTEARVNLGFFAKVIKEAREDIVYKITGYADKGTGTPEINERLSKARAQAIYDVLVKEFNVPTSQLQVDHKGGVENMYYNDPRLSRSVITISDLLQ
ncbi:OmpA family protein [Sphingobacterium sp. SRCM116780]|uniref:OmpA family protein n=1 Tax=Sphingobacterium sp. SRCM116780 TaxID=2907623 RepID=UPI001F2DE6E9|nr:OmpA family protein [Sphingobacterium sp. SRCM116780]UIR56020.1 OmpA family protein [Sphingobacterium sp. SRCM116780]